MGKHASSKNQTTVPAASTAIMHCTSSSRPSDAIAKAATPRGLNGSQARGNDWAVEVIS